MLASSQALRSTPPHGRGATELELELILSRWLWERGEKGGASLQKTSARACAVWCNAMKSVHRVNSALLIMGMINCEGRALELLRLIFSTRGVSPPQGLERQHSFEAKPQPNYIKVGAAIILSRRRIHLAVISETTMPGSLTFRPIFLARRWVDPS